MGSALAEYKPLLEKYNEKRVAKNKPTISFDELIVSASQPGTRKLRWEILVSGYEHPKNFWHKLNEEQKIIVKYYYLEGLSQAKLSQILSPRDNPNIMGVSRQTANKMVKSFELWLIENVAPEWMSPTDKKWFQSLTDKERNLIARPETKSDYQKELKNEYQMRKDLATRTAIAHLSSEAGGHRHLMAKNYLSEIIHPNHKQVEHSKLPLPKNLQKKIDKILNQ